MKLQLQLFIEGSQIELHDNESVTLTQTYLQILQEHLTYLLQKLTTKFSNTFTNLKYQYKILGQRKENKQFYF